MQEAVSSQSPKVLPAGNAARLRRVRRLAASRPAASSASRTRTTSAGSQRWALAVGTRSFRARRDVIISGGENVYSIEVEDAVATHPAVARCAVVGVPDERFGKAVCAVVELTPAAVAAGTTLGAAELREHVATRIARYKAPRSTVVIEALPVLPTGKIDKKGLRTELAASPQVEGA